MQEARAEKKSRLETAVPESRPDIQDDIQAINDQQEEEISIDPGMREHGLVAHWDGSDDEEEDFEYTDNEKDLGDLEYEEIAAFTQFMKGKGKNHTSTVKCNRGPKTSRSTRSLTFSSLRS
jgi:hypothetical protein